MDAYAWFTTETATMARRVIRTILTALLADPPAGSAAVAAGLVTFSLGSVPMVQSAFRHPERDFWSQANFRPSVAYRQSPFVPGLDHIGPFARTVEDLATVYDVLGVRLENGNYPTLRLFLYNVVSTVRNERYFRIPAKIITPDVISTQIDMFPARGRKMRYQLLIYRDTFSF